MRNRMEMRRMKMRRMRKQFGRVWNGSKRGQAGSDQKVMDL